MPQLNIAVSVDIVVHIMKVFYCIFHNQSCMIVLTFCFKSQCFKFDFVC